MPSALSHRITHLLRPNMSQPEGDDGGRAPSPPPPRKVKKQVPQKNIDDFWAAFTTAFPGKVHTILPQNAYARSKAAREPKGPVYGRNTIRSYDEARDECVQTVAMIARECRRVNMRYRDPHFDIEFDLKSKKQDCLHGLIVYPDAGWPKSVKRVHVGALPCWISTRSTKSENRVLIWGS